MHIERRRTLRSGEREELEHLLTSACGRSYALQAQEERLRRTLVSTARRLEPDALRADLAEIAARLDAVGDEAVEIRARISRLRAELSRTEDAWPRGPRAA